MYDVRIIGAGLAGCESALQLANAGFKVRLIEMKPKKKTPAQKLDGLCELVCSNSFRSTKKTNAVALLKDEMLELDGILMGFALKAQVPAGDSLSVDRVIFSSLVEQAIKSHKNIDLITEEAIFLPHDNIPTIVATGPLTSDPLAADIAKFIGSDRLYFYDAIAPIIDAETIDMNEAFIQSRWQEEGGDYINCPMDKDTYEQFVDHLNQASYAKAHEFEDAKYFEGCLPIEVIAERGKESLRFGPFKPVGLFNPHKQEQPYAVLQLRKEDKYGVSYNIVGCQTRMTIGEQKKAFALIPALKEAKFMRFGSVHRNTYINSPKVLNEELRLLDTNKNPSNIFLAGQITGVEGYVESMAMGLIVSKIILSRLLKKDFIKLPTNTALGGLYGHVLGQHMANDSQPFVPSNITWAMIPSIKTKKMSRAERRTLLYNQAILAIKDYRDLNKNSLTVHSSINL